MRLGRMRAEVHVTLLAHDLPFGRPWHFSMWIFKILTWDFPTKRRNRPRELMHPILSRSPMYSPHPISLAVLRPCLQGRSHFLTLNARNVPPTCFFHSFPYQAPRFRLPPNIPLCAFAPPLLSSGRMAPFALPPPPLVCTPLSCRAVPEWLCSHSLRRCIAHVYSLLSHSTLRFARPLFEKPIL